MLKVYFKDGTIKRIDWETLKKLLHNNFLKEQKKYIFPLRDMRDEFDYLATCIANKRGGNVKFIALGGND